jgi:NTP pyrophosphatase (non-canonical NTP hydrolase)
MDIKQLTDEMNQFVEAKGWYRPGSRAPQTPRNIATSLAIEAAEVLEHFQWNETAKDRDELAGELADVALYLLQLAYLTDIDLEQAILDKLAVNYDRTWPENEALESWPSATKSRTHSTRRQHADGLARLISSWVAATCRTITWNI